ncbi:unnamed protein product [Ranitomeya imitator]|uniref:Large ribosomal subunit protein mL46 n=1 Tax=Ranitomeya imitator TaxID=111125 RepID=A0ABN9LGA0_9NEOB|nr:unnamed protein product [Ranitomeya imitator]
MAAPVRRLLTGALWCRAPGFRASVAGCRGLASAPGSTGSPWRLHGAVCLKRPAVVSQSKTPLQREVEELLKQIDLEKSFHSDHELQLMKDAERLRRKQSDTYDSDDEEEEQDIVMAQDMEDTWEQKWKQMKLAPRVTDSTGGEQRSRAQRWRTDSVSYPIFTLVTGIVGRWRAVCVTALQRPNSDAAAIRIVVEADEQNDRSSLHRKLENPLVLLVKEKIGNEEVWMFPQVEWMAGETMRQTAQRALSNVSENSIEAHFLGNAPCGFYKYKFPKALRSEDKMGAKVFFFKALLKNKSAPTNKKKGDYVWVSKDELKDYLKPAYLSEVYKFVIEV